MKIRLYRASIVLLVALMLSSAAQATIFSDGFEASSLDTFWTIATQTYYDISLVASPTHSGSQSLALTSIYNSSSDSTAEIEHYWTTPQTGSFSVWFYDHNPSSPDNYAGLYVSGPSSGTGLSIVDYNTNYYYGPSGQTTIARTLGWHKFEIMVSGTGASTYIDGVFAGSKASVTSFDTIQLWGGRASFRPAATYGFDDFAINSIPEPATLSVLTLGGLALLRRRYT